MIGIISQYCSILQLQYGIPRTKWSQLPIMNPPTQALQHKSPPSDTSLGPTLVGMIPHGHSYP